MTTQRPGIALYVSLPDEDAARLVDAADVLRELALDLLPDAETVTELALVPVPDDPYDHPPVAHGGGSSRRRAAAHR
jgi:hypothetical protein